MEPAHSFVLDSFPPSMLAGFHPAAEAADPMEEISERLHRHLDPEQVLRCFARELAAKLRFSTLSYQHGSLSLELGRKGTHQTRYPIRLSHQGQPLGEICYGFRQMLSPMELDLLHRFHNKLLQPLFVAWQFASLKTQLEQEPLTGLLNRSSFDRQLDERVQMAQQGEAPLSLLLLDLDCFKQVNDTHGHAAGDAVLRLVGETLRAGIRPQDRAFRFGGDEFAILLAADSTIAERVGERLRQQIGALPELNHYGISCSIGLGQSQPLEDTQELFERCDSALYQAKSAGRNRLVVH